MGPKNEPYAPGGALRRCKPCSPNSMPWSDHSLIDIILTSETLSAGPFGLAGRGRSPYRWRREVWTDYEGTGD